MCFCEKCGKKLKGNEKYCPACGNPVHEYKGKDGRDDTKPDETVRGRTAAGKKRKKWYYAAAAAVLLAAAGIAGGLAIKGQYVKQQAGNYVADGDRYLEELDYEKAEDSYLEAIEIAPKEKEPYLKLTELYLGSGEVEKAQETISRAKESVQALEKGGFEALEQEYGSLESYTVAEEGIEADDIFYFRYGNYMEYSENELNRQMFSRYAVVSKDGLFGLVKDTGELAADIVYTGARTAGPVCVLHTENPVYSEEYGIEINDFYLNEQTGEMEPAVAIWGPDVDGYKGTFYYCDGELHNTKEIYEEMYGGSEPYVMSADAVGVKRSDSLYTKADDLTGWGQELPGLYAIYSNGDLVTDFIYEECGSESSGLLAVKKDGKWGYVNENGEVVIPLEYDASWEQYAPDVISDAEPYCYAASEGYVPLVKDGVWEMRNTAGSLVIAPGVFEEIRPVYNGKCWVKKDGIWHVIELAGENLGTEIKSKEKSVSSDTREAAQQVEADLVQEFGAASGEEFLSCQDMELMDFPAAEMGYISQTLADIDGDGTEELLAVYLNPSDKGLYLRLYRYQNGIYSLVNEERMTEMDNFSQVTAYLFYNGQQEEYQVFCTNNTVGSYTATALITSLYSLGDQIRTAGEWEWVSALNTWEDCEQMQMEMQDAGVPWMETGIDSFGNYDSTAHTILVKSEVRVEGDIPTMSAVYLRIYSGR